MPELERRLEDINAQLAVPITVDIGLFVMKRGSGRVTRLVA